MYLAKEGIHDHVSQVNVELCNSCTKVTSPPSNGACNFPITCHIIYFIKLLGVEFNNAHFGTLFAPKIIKLHLIEGTYSGM